MLATVVLVGTFLSFFFQFWLYYCGAIHSCSFHFKTAAICQVFTHSKNDKLFFLEVNVHFRGETVSNASYGSQTVANDFWLFFGKHMFNHWQQYSSWSKFVLSILRTECRDQFPSYCRERIARHPRKSACNKHGSKMCPKSCGVCGKWRKTFLVRAVFVGYWVHLRAGKSQLLFFCLWICSTRRYLFIKFCHNFD